LRCLGHLLWEDDVEFVKRSILHEVEDVRGSGRPRMMWNQTMEKDMRKCELNKVDV